jgi:type II secretion system protein H
MTLPTTKSGKIRRRSGFTLVEMMLVMALLVIVIGVAFPSLKSFFKGRDLDSEVQRFLALTRYGQSRAVSEGVPMELWIDAKQGAYGLQAQAGFSDSDTKDVTFNLGKDLRLEVSVAAPARQFGTVKSSVSNDSNLSSIRFLPDGYPSDTSPERIQFRDGDEHAIAIVQSSNRLTYEIEPNNSQNLRR